MSQLTFNEVAAPGTPSTGKVTVYTKSDGFVYSKDDAGTEYQLSWIAATQAQQETGTSLLVTVTPGRQHYHQSAAKAWVKFDVNGGLNASYNVTSVTDSGTGDLTINWATDFSTTHYSCVVTLETTNVLIGRINSSAAGTARIITVNLTPAVADADYWHAAAFGDHA